MVVSFRSKKDRLAIDITRLLLKMLPLFYQAHLRKQLSANQYILLNLLVELLQGQKQVRIERLAAPRLRRDYSRRKAGLPTYRYQFYLRAVAASCKGS